MAKHDQKSLDLPLQEQCYTTLIKQTVSMGNELQGGRFRKGVES
jgi:hypothetical protein